MNVIDLLIIIGIPLFGLLFVFIIADRYWGTEILGKTIPPRPTLIYEGRPWWMKRILLFITIGSFESALSLITFYIFMPNTLDDLIIPIITLWVILVFSIVMNVVFREEEETTRQVDADSGTSIES